MILPGSCGTKLNFDFMDLATVTHRHDGGRGQAAGRTVGPFTVLKFKDQNFISNIYYRKGPSFTTVSRCVRSLAGQPNFTAHFQRAPLLLQQYQGEGNTGVVMFQKSSNIFSSCFILSWKRLL